MKIGDKVRVRGDWYSGMTSGSAYNLPRHAGIIVEGGSDSGYIKINYNGIISPAVNPVLFELVNDNSPIRTVTRREIVPGVYGIVNVMPDGTMSLTPKARRYTIEDYRSAARIFNEIADVLEENSRDENAKDIAA